MATKTKTRQRAGLTIDQLKGEALEAALEWGRERYEWDDMDSQQLSEQFQEVLDYEFGWPDMKVWWSLGYCQSDYVAIEGTVDFSDLCKKDEELQAKCKEMDLLAVFNDVNWDCPCSLRFSHDHYYAQKMDIDEPTYGWDGHPEHLQDAWESFTEWLNGRLKERLDAALSRLKKVGYAEIEYRWEDAYITDMLESNGDLFSPDGTEYDEEWEADDGEAEED